MSVQISVKMRRESQEEDGAQEGHELMERVMKRLYLSGVFDWYGGRPKFRLKDRLREYLYKSALIKESAEILVRSNDGIWYGYPATEREKII